MEQVTIGSVGKITSEWVACNNFKQRYSMIWLMFLRALFALCRTEYIGAEMKTER